jgi:LysR family glycine cleavage system transcriptional activator
MFGALPSLNAIKMFEAASRLKSFKLAASELNVSPTAVSHQVRNLEEALNTKLFIRRTRSISLTAEGEQLAAAVHRSLRDLLQSVNAVRDVSDILHVGTTNSFAAMWLVPRLEAFKKLNPGVEVQLHADDRLYEPDNDRRIDMVVRYGKYREQENAELLINENLGCFATPDYWHRYKATGQGIFLCASWKNKSLPQQDFKLIPSDKSQEVYYFSDENQMLQAALAGQGIAIISELLVNIPLQNSWLTQGLKGVSSSMSGLDYYCVVPNRNQSNQNVLRFVAWLRAHLTSEGDAVTQIPQ